MEKGVEHYILWIISDIGYYGTNICQCLFDWLIMLQRATQIFKLFLAASWQTPV